MKDFFKESDCEPLVFRQNGNSFTLNLPKPNSYISLEKANRLLHERGKVVRSRGGELWDALVVYPEHTQQALLINVEAIEDEDSAESLLRDLITEMDKWNSAFCGSPLYTRAKALLAKERA